MPSHQSPSGQSRGEVIGLPLQENQSDCSRAAQYALVLGSSSHVKQDLPVPARSAQSANSLSTRFLTGIC